ncbi:class F sortase [Streptomyces sp. JJ66]|uniref:class F sortase n=1 Tax=Streptomyces sp. JJ66 TaxID=2803843 RepID=UPI001C56C501|nr:class F sortase [Streptomyces sp. JJ66]MBW1604745.1 class F sortase [Streptomyces sp. JJ66]
MTTRQQRIAAGGRRLETVAAVVTVLVAGALCAAAGPDGPGEERRARVGLTTLADGVSRPQAVDTERPAAESVALPRSVPTRVRIPQLKADIEVFPAPAEKDGTPPVPDEGDADRVAWYEHGASPGEPGPALLVGHLDTEKGPAAFAGIASLKPGAEVRVARADGSTVVFAIDSVEQYAKDRFPNDRVYGPTQRPQLRLITCGGSWTKEEGYDANIVAFASLTR